MEFSSLIQYITSFVFAINKALVKYFTVFSLMKSYRKRPAIHFVKNCFKSKL